MSIDLYFHSPLDSDHVAKALANLAKLRPDFFDNDFLIYDPGSASEVDREIAQEFDFNSETVFFGPPEREIESRRYQRDGGNRKVAF